jgi:hypothetical protein
MRLKQNMSLRFDESAHSSSNSISERYFRYSCSDGTHGYNDDLVPQLKLKLNTE